VSISQKLVNQHKRLAMGDTIKGFAKGGSVASDIPSVSVRSTGKAVNPLTTAKRNNGIPGFKKGGKTC